jgi:4-aminobutyrate aminotransferase-like enzyme/Ser/Thr protein kinase RdoA (MazF antagonist)
MTVEFDAATVSSDMVTTQWGTTAQITDLASTQDHVFRLEFNDGGRAVMKLSRADRIEEDALHAEAAALLHLHRALPWLQVPLLLPGSDGLVLQQRGDFTGRMMSWVDGVALERAPHWRRSSLHALGQAAGQISRTLADFTHDGLRTYMEWDPRQAVSVVQRLLPEVASNATRSLLTAALRSLRDDLPAADKTQLPEQAVHLDLTDRNVLGRFDDDGNFTPVGVIDFGDMVWTWRICELAVSIHAAMGRSLTDPLAAAVPVVEGFAAHQPITEAEADRLWTLVLARAATCVAIETVEAIRFPDNDHVRDTAELDTAVLRAALAVDPRLSRSVLRTSCGLAAWPVDVLDQLRRADPVDIVRIPAPAVGSAWQEVLHISDEIADSVAPEAMQLGTTYVLPAASAILAPLDGDVVTSSQTAMTLKLRLDHTLAYLHLDGVRPTWETGDSVTRGQLVGHAGIDDTSSTRDCDVTVQLGIDPAMPRYGKVRDRTAWSALCPDPGLLVGHPAPARTELSALDERNRHVAAAQRLYYRTPPQMVRARGQWMFDDTGRRYLDMVNNVAIVGHSHPRITAAAADQLSVLNTNSRFLYRAIAEYADRIADTLPSQLSRIFLVNSGSEAMELALQLARCFTAQRDVIALDGAYHGWTTEVFELCTMPGDRPNWRRELAPYVHIADCPDWYRGAHGAQSAPYLHSLSEACRRAETNGGLAGFVHEPISGSRGGIAPPPGYLAEAYAIVRAFGGLCIADEVQVGYGRTGKSFWAFEGQNVVPDIVAAAKAAGNGHPVGFIACRADIADAFANQSTFFSTPAGNPVSCRIGSAVLDVIRDERLQDNARDVGEYLAVRLAELADRHREIGAVYGLGLYQGIDLVNGDGSKTPLPASAIDAICERLLELGCIVQPTGLHGNVLKVKPPLCLERSDAECFLDAVDQMLSERAAFRSLSSDTATPRWRIHD